MEVDIFRSWRLVSPTDFHTVQTVHWHKLPYWVFAPLGLALVGSVALLWLSPHALSRVGHVGQFGLPALLPPSHRDLLGPLAGETESG